MNTQSSETFLQAAPAERTVYVRPVVVADLPQDLQEEAGTLEQIFALHAPDGTRMALVRDRDMAFALARQHDFAPVNVH